MGLFHVFQIVQMVPNRANYHIYTLHCINWVVIEHVNNLFHCNWTRPQNHLVRKRTSEFWVFVYELSEFWVFVFVSVRLRTGSGFEYSCSHLNFRFRACFEQGIAWHSGNYRGWIHCETRTWHDKNIQPLSHTMKILVLEIFF